MELNGIDFFKCGFDIRDAWIVRIQLLKFKSRRFDR